MIVDRTNTRNLTLELVKNDLNNFNYVYPYNPDDLIYNMKSEYGQSGYDLYAEISKDPKVSSIESIIRQAVFNTEYGIIYDIEKYQNQEIEDFCNYNLDNIKNDSFTNILRNMMDARLYGFKVAEKIYKYDNGKLVIDKIKAFPSSYFDFRVDNQNNLIEIILHQGKAEQTIFKVDDFNSKFIYFVYPNIKDGNYYGESALKPIYQLWRVKKRLGLIAPIAFELRFIPPIINEYYEGLDKPSQTAVKNAVSDMRNYSRVSIPSRLDEKGGLHPLANLKILNTEINNFDDIKSHMEYLDKEIARSLGVPDEIGFSTTNVGSNAKANTQIKVFNQLVKEEQKKIERLVNEQILKPLIDVNFGKQEVYPVFKFHRSDYDELYTKMDILKIMREAGLTPDTDFIKDFIDIPIKEDEIDDRVDEQEEPEIQKEQEPIEQKEQEEQEQEEMKAVSETDKFEALREKIEDSNITFFTNNITKRVDFKAIDKFWDKLEAGFLRRLVQHFNEARLEFIKQAKRGKEFEFRKFNKNKIRDYIYAFCLRAYLDGKYRALQEIQKAVDFQASNEFVIDYILLEQKENFATTADELIKVQDVIQEYLDKGIKLTRQQRKNLVAIKKYAGLITNQITGEIQSQVSLIYDYTPGDVSVNQIIKGIDDVFKKYTSIVNNPEKIFIISQAELSHHYINTILRTNISRYFNQGRYDQMTDPDLNGVVTAMQYSAILDGRTTYFCREHDGEVIAIDDPRIQSLQPPNHFNCRSLFAPVFRQDNEEANWGEKAQDKPEKQEAYNSPAEGFGGQGRVSIPRSMEE